MMEGSAILATKYLKLKSKLTKFQEHAIVLKMQEKLNTNDIKTNFNQELTKRQRGTIT